MKGIKGSALGAQGARGPGPNAPMRGEMMGSRSLSLARQLRTVCCVNLVGVGAVWARDRSSARSASISG